MARPTHVWISVATTCALLLTQALCHAHGGAAAGVGPLYDAQGDLVGVASSIGLMRVDADKIRLFQNYPAPIAWASLRADGAVLVGGSQGMASTTDWGCTWGAEGGELAARNTAVFAPDPVSGAPLLIGTADEDGDDAIWRTDDGGLNWSRVDGTDSAAPYRAIAWLPGADQFVAVAAHGDATPATLRLAEASGLEWETLADALPAGANPRLLGGLEEGLEVLVAVETDNGDGLWSVDLADGAASLLVESQGAGRFAQGAWHASGLWIVDSADILSRWDGETLVDAGQDARSCIWVEPRDGLLWTCGERPASHLFYTTDAPVQWDQRLSFLDVVLGQCPTPEPEPEPEPAPGAQESGQIDEGSCACATQSPTRPRWVLAILGLARLR